LKKNISFKKRLALNVFNRYVNVQTQLHELTYFFWECTLRCNIHCLHCGSDCHRDAKMKDMPIQDFLKITEQIKTQYDPHKVMVVITGGEPLMRDDLEECGKALHQQGFPWGMVSNGYLLTKKRFDQLIQSGLRSMTISLDGLEENHNWLRGRNDSFSRAVEAIGYIVKQPDFIYDIVTCVNQKNFLELEELKSFLIKIGVKLWRLFTIFPIGRASDNPLLDVTSEQFSELMNFIKDTRVEGKIIASYGCEGFLGNYENEVREGFYFCHAGINIGSVLADGSICACPNINHKFIQGNIYSDNFLDVWNNRFEVMRNRSWTKQHECTDCDVYKWCKGNGMHLHHDTESPVMRCHYNMINKI